MPSAPSTSDRPMRDVLLQKIQDRKATVGIIGLGYVGLPLAVEFAKGGFKVIGYDVSERVVRGLMEGRSHIQDVSSSDIAKLVKQKLFEATTDQERLRQADLRGNRLPEKLRVREDARAVRIQPGEERIAARPAERELRRGVASVAEGGAMLAG